MAVPTFFWRDATKNTLVIETQLPDGWIKRVTVHGLELSNRIYRKYTVDTSMRDVIMDSDENNLVLPLQFDIAESFTLPQRNTLYADSALMVINSYEITKLKWYQSSFFKFLVIVVALIITIWTGQAWVLELAAAIGAGLAALLMFLATSFLIAFAIQVAATWLIKTYGDQFGVIGAIVMAVVAIVLTRGKGTAEAMKFMMTTAQYILQGAMALISATNEFLVEEGKKIVNEYADFSAKLEDRYEDLKTATDLLEWKSDLDPLMFARPSRLRSMPSESPDAFYTRCLGLASNTMYVIHDEIPTFFDARLKLDKNIPFELLT